MNDNRNSIIVEFACSLALLELVQIHNLLPNELMDEDGSNYLEEFQDEFDRYYDTYYSQLKNL